MMTWLRAILAGALLLWGLWVVVGEQIAGVSADAVVNGHVATLRSPIAGVVSIPKFSLGARLGQSEAVATVRNPRADLAQRDNLLLENARIDAQIARIRARIASLTEVEAQLDKRITTYRRFRAEEIRIGLQEAQAQLRILEASPDQILDDQAVTAGLSGSDAPTSLLAPRSLAVSYARERVAALENELAALEARAFLGDGYNDSPAAEQRQQQLADQRTEYAILLDAAVAEAEAVEDRLGLEQARVASLSEAVLAAPQDGRFWEYLAHDGTNIEQGEPVVRLLLCNSALVTASVSENVYNKLRYGDAATFRLTGDGQLYEATISRLGGAGAASFYRNLAIAPSQQHLQRYDVALQVPALATHPATDCNAGLTGRVFFGPRPLDFFRQLRG